MWARLLDTFKYDPFGRRIEKISPTATSIFAYDGVDLVQTVNSTGGLVAHYTQTMNIDEPLAMQRSGTTYYYDADGLGSITSLSSSAGALANTYSYDSFGNVTNSTGSVTNFLEYTGREFDTETGLYYYRARYYDPSVGRFLNEDPARFVAGQDFYIYASDNPTLRTDPLGLDPSDGSCGKCPDSPKGWRPNSVGLGLTGTGAAGLGPLGGTTVTGTLGLSSSPTSTRGFATGGVGTSAGNYATGLPGNQSMYGKPVTAAYGAYAGGGVAVNLSNGEPCQLRGPFHTINLDIGFGVDFSGTIAFSDSGVWQASLGVPGLNWGFGADLNFVNTNTGVSGR